MSRRNDARGAVSRHRELAHRARLRGGENQATANFLALVIRPVGARADVDQIRGDLSNPKGFSHLSKFEK